MAHRTEGEEKEKSNTDGTRGSGLVPQLMDVVKRKGSVRGARMAHATRKGEISNALPDDGNNSTYGPVRGSHAMNVVASRYHPLLANSRLDTCDGILNEDGKWIEVIKLDVSTANPTRNKHLAQMLKVQLKDKDEIGNVSKNQGYQTDIYDGWRWNGRKEKEAKDDVRNTLKRLVLPGIDGIQLFDTNDMPADWKPFLFLLNTDDMDRIFEAITPSISVRPDYCFLKCNPKVGDPQKLLRSLVIAINVKCEDSFESNSEHCLERARNELMYLEGVRQKWCGSRPPILFEFSMGFRNPVAFYFILEKDENGKKSKVGLCCSELTDEAMIEWLVQLCANDNDNDNVMYIHKDKNKDKNHGMDKEASEPKLPCIANPCDREEEDRFMADSAFFDLISKWTHVSDLTKKVGSQTMAQLLSENKNAFFAFAMGGDTTISHLQGLAAECGFDHLTSAIIAGNLVERCRWERQGILDVMEQAREDVSDQGGDPLRLSTYIDARLYDEATREERLQIVQDARKQVNQYVLANKKE